MTFKSVPFTIVLGVSLVACLLVAGALWLVDPLNLSAPRDQELIVIFRNHRMIFEELRQMAANDRQEESYFSKFELSEKLSEARKQSYRTLISEIASKLVVTVDHTGAGVRFHFAYGGLSAIGPGWAKGIEYVGGIPGKRGTILNDLDTARRLPPDIYLRQIEPEWFIFYERFE